MWYLLESSNLNANMFTFDDPLLRASIIQRSSNIIIGSISTFFFALYVSAVANKLLWLALPEFHGYVHYACIFLTFFTFSTSYTSLLISMADYFISFRDEKTPRDVSEMVDKPNEYFRKIQLHHILMGIFAGQIMNPESAKRTIPFFMALVICISMSAYLKMLSHRVRGSSIQKLNVMIISIFSAIYIMSARSILGLDVSCPFCMLRQIIVIIIISTMAIDNIAKYIDIMDWDDMPNSTDHVLICALYFYIGPIVNIIHNPTAVYFMVVLIGLIVFASIVS